MEKKILIQRFELIQAIYLINAREENLDKQLFTAFLRAHNTDLYSFELLFLLNLEVCSEIPQLADRKGRNNAAGKGNHWYHHENLQAYSALEASELDVLSYTTDLTLSQLLGNLHKNFTVSFTNGKFYYYLLLEV